jgi:hypothetical protein
MVEKYSFIYIYIYVYSGPLIVERFDA